MGENFEAEIEQSLKHIFDSFSYTDTVPVTDVKKIFTPAEYMRVLHLLYSAIFSPSNSQIVYSILTAYIHEFLKKVVRSHIDNEIPAMPDEFLRRFTRVMEHYEKLAKFTERFFIYGDKKEHLMFNFRELYSKKIFNKLFCEQILLVDQPKILNAISGYLDGRLLAAEFDPQLLWDFFSHVFLFTDVEVANVPGFLKALAQRVQQEVTRQAARHFEGLTALSPAQLMNAAWDAKDLIESHVGALFPSQKIFTESARQCHEFIRRLLTSEVLPRILREETGGGAELFDILDADGLTRLLSLVQTAQPTLKPLKSALSEYIKANVLKLLGTGEDVHFSAIIAFFCKADGLVRLLNGDANLQTTVTECIDWVMTSNAGLPLPPFALQIRYLEMLRQLVTQQAIDPNETFFAVVLAFVPFLDAKLFEASFAQFFCRWILNTNHRRSLAPERRLAQLVQATLGEDPCKAFMSVFHDLDEFQKGQEKFDEFARRDEFVGLPRVRVSHVFSALLDEKLQLPEFELFRPAQCLYTTFFLAQRQNMNRAVWLSFDLGSCECELRLDGRTLAVKGTPLEMAVIAEVLARGRLSKEELLQVCTGGKSELEASVRARLDVILPKLVEVGLFTVQQGGYALASSFAAEGPVEVFAYDCYETQAVAPESAKPAEIIDGSRVSAFIAHFAKVQGQFTHEQLSAAVSAEMPALEAKRFALALNNVIELGIIKRTKNAPDTFQYSSR